MPFSLKDAENQSSSFKGIGVRTGLIGIEVIDVDDNDMQHAEIDLEPTSGVQEKLVPERVVDGLPTMYCF